MSGGGLDYLQIREPGDVLAGRYDEALKRMADRLEAIGAHPEAQRVRQFREYLATERERIRLFLYEWNRVIHAVDFEISADVTVEDVSEAITKRRVEVDINGAVKLPGDPEPPTIPGRSPVALDLFEEFPAPWGFDPRTGFLRAANGEDVEMDGLLRAGGGVESNRGQRKRAAFLAIINAAGNPIPPDLLLVAVRLAKCHELCKAGEATWLSSVYQPDPALPPIGDWQSDLKAAAAFIVRLTMPRPPERSPRAFGRGEVPTEPGIYWATTGDGPDDPPGRVLVRRWEGATHDDGSHNSLPWLIIGSDEIYPDDDFWDFFGPIEPAGQPPRERPE